MWTGDDTLLVLYAVLGVALIVVLITSPLKLHPFLALLIGSTLVGLAFGLGPVGVIESVKAGAGDVPGNATWSIMETLISTVGFMFVLLASVLV